MICDRRVQDVRPELNEIHKRSHVALSYPVVVAEYNFFCSLRLQYMLCSVPRVGGGEIIVLLIHNVDTRWR